MAPLDSDLFLGGESDICDTDIQNCEAKDVGTAIGDILTDYGWNQKAVAGILLHLSPDNERVAAGSFFLRGTEEKEYEVNAGKLWVDADMGVTVTIRLPSMDSFVFTDGGMTSDFLPGDEVVHYLHECREGAAPKPILTNNLREYGVGSFCLRLVCHPSKTSNTRNGIRIKYHVMIYPAGVGELRQMSRLVCNASWPGIKLGEGECVMLPTPTTPWGCPILPLLRPGVPFATAPQAPGGAALRHAIAGIMGRCGAPEVARSAASLAAKWERINSNEADFQPKLAPVTWPVATPPAPSTGE